MEIFSALLALCVGNSPVPGEFPAERPVTRSFDVFFDTCRNKPLRNNREAGDFRRHCAHYDVNVMSVLAVSTVGLAPLYKYWGICRHSGDKFQVNYINTTLERPIHLYQLPTSLWSLNKHIINCAYILCFLLTTLVLARALHLSYTYHAL